MSQAIIMLLVLTHIKSWSTVTMLFTQVNIKLLMTIYELEVDVVMGHGCPDGMEPPSISMI